MRKCSDVRKIKRRDRVTFNIGIDHSDIRAMGVHPKYNLTPKCEGVVLRLESSDSIVVKFDGQDREFYFPPHFLKKRIY